MGAPPGFRHRRGARTVGWYRQVQVGAGSALEWCQPDLALYQKNPSP
jgi:hypothetical protein